MEQTKTEVNNSLEKSADVMLNRKAWKNDIKDFKIGTKVLLCVDTDTNRKTRKKPLYNHLDLTIYEIVDIKEDFVDIKSETKIMKNIHVMRLKIYINKKE